MVQEEKLQQFYYSQYRDCAARRKKRSSGVSRRDYAEKISLLAGELRALRGQDVSPARLEDYHRQVRNVAYWAFRDENPIALMTLRDEIMEDLVRLDLESMSSTEREIVTARFLERLRGQNNYEICQRTLPSLVRDYANSGIREQIIGLVPTHPETEFPQARAMKRHFILHVGPTNCGKTYQALERLKTASAGVYLGPLRLLALEVYEKMNESGIPCTMLTGEERIYEEGSRITSSTIEMLDIDRPYEIAVIDECQMITDRERGHSWTRAILGVRAGEIHLCLSEPALKVIRHLIELCGDTWEMHRYERKTALVCEDKPFVFPDDVQDGDALIVFTKRAVLDIAGRLEQEGIRSSVIYGSLPPEIRRRQIRLFAERETRVVVSTDAIGMGLNLPVRRIVFLQMNKFDGRGNRLLTASEIKQIAGRAGRFGIFDTGYVTAAGEDNLEYLREHFEQTEPDIEYVSLGFPQVLLDMDEPLDAVMNVWKADEAEPPFRKVSIEEVLTLYDLAYNARRDIDGFEDKRILYRMLTCPIDLKNRDIVDLWLHYCKTYTADVALDFPEREMCSDSGQMQCETYYRMLDLYYQFSTRMGKNIDVQRLRDEREETEDEIMRYLAKDKKNYIHRCQYCGAMLPMGAAYRVCDRCYGQERRLRVYRRGAGSRRVRGTDRKPAVSSAPAGSAPAASSAGGKKHRRGHRSHKSTAPSAVNTVQKRTS